MIPGAAIFLTLLPLAGVPVIFHLLLRRKRKKYVFSTPMFLHKVDPKMRSRRRLQEILLGEHLGLLGDGCLLGCHA